MSIFSDLNNLMDISMMAEYADICGITDKELRQYFELQIIKLAQVQKLSHEKALAKLADMYDGYHFGSEVVGVYNPFSLLCALRAKEYGSYWFETGTPTFLADALREIDYDLEQLTHEEVSAEVLGDVSAWRSYPIPMLYQSGYLTVHYYDREFDSYTLGFPNQEVERAFIRFLMPRFLP